ncbi:MAG: DUF1559 domain-containing protein [Thermogutta sp.]
MKRAWKTLTVWLLTAALVHGHWLAALSAASEPALLVPTSAPKVERAPTQTTDRSGALPGSDARSLEGQATADLAYVPPTATAAVILHPRRVLTAPESELLPLEVISAVGKKEFGLEPLEIEWAVAVAEVGGFGPPQLGLVLGFSAPIDDSHLFTSLKQDAEKQTLEGRPYYRSRDLLFMPSIFLPNDHTVVVAQEIMLQKMLRNHQDPRPGKVSRILDGMKRLPDAAVAVDFEPLRPLVRGFLMQAPLPPPLAALQDVPRLVADVEARVDFIESPSMYLAVRSNNDADALKLQNIIAAMLEEVTGMVLGQVQSRAASEDAVEQAAAQYLNRITDRFLAILQPDREGDTLFLRFDEEQRVQVATAGILVALLLPAVQAAREAARRAQSTNNLKQLGLALHNYHDVHGHFPPQAINDPNGRPLLSWRVSILPYLECRALYEQFHLDEPWDSDHNRELIPLMPEVYRNPTAPAEPGMAHYLALVGPGTLFEGRDPRSLSDISDGTSKTLMLVEVDPDRAVVWTKPEDLPFDPANPLDGLGNAHPGGFNALFCDGSVRFISAVIDETLFRYLAEIADGESIELDD